MKVSINAELACKLCKQALTNTMVDIEAAGKKLSELSNMQSKTEQQKAAEKIVADSLQNAIITRKHLTRMERTLSVLGTSIVDLTEPETQLLSFAKSVDEPTK